MGDRAELAGGSVQSVDRALAILELLAEQGAAQVTEVAAALGIHKSTASRLLSTLERRGLVDQPNERGSYRLGYGLLHLASAVTSNVDLRREARPVCEELCAAVEETVNIAVRRGIEVINIEQTIATASVVNVNWIGKRNPVHATSTGKVLLACLPDSEMFAVVVDLPLERYTPSTIVDRAVLLHELEQVRKQGYAQTIEELEVGMNAVGAPIRDFGGSTVAALSVTGPAYRLSAERIPDVALHTMSAASDISRRLGYQAGTV